MRRFDGSADVCWLRCHRTRKSVEQSGLHSALVQDSHGHRVSKQPTIRRNFEDAFVALN
jgi:hypothetical protein